MARKKKSRFTKGEKTLYCFGAICFIGMIVLRTFFGAGIGNYKMNVEKIRFEITDAERRVESLSMQVNELTSFDNVNRVVRELGLAYNNNQIIVIND